MAKHYFKRHALELQLGGYEIIPIRPGKKRPFGKEWESTTYGPNRIGRFVEAGRGHFGVGIKTRYTPGVDIDCYNEKLVNHMIDFCQELCGETLQRVGMAPKTLLVYRTKKPFPKTQSKVFIDDQGRPVKLEVLGNGQQFVAFHVHPDTGRPYEWLGGESLLDVAQADLQLIERDDAFAMVSEFEKQCRKLGWKEKSTVKRLEGGGSYDPDDPFADVKERVDISDEDLLAKLHMVPNPSDYDTWFHVGMALYHQFDGAQQGLDYWHEWSAQASNYDMDVLEEKWPTFAIEGKKREPLTARFILKQAKEEEERLAGEQLDDIRKKVKKIDDMRSYNEVCETVKRLPFDPITRETLASLLKAQIKKAVDVPFTLPAVRKHIAFENPDNRATPWWLRAWCYVQMDETFYNRRTGQTLSRSAFDATYGRHLLSKKDVLEGKAIPEQAASFLALNRYQVPVVSNRMYMPHDEEFFTANGREYVNTYSGVDVPEDLTELTSKQKRVMKRITNHVAHLFPIVRDQQLFLSWMAYIVQTGKRSNWSPVLQGVEGDGKSWFGQLLAVALGGSNVEIINGLSLAEKYTPWAEGSQVVMIEEVRLHGTDRYAIINNLKPYVTNVTVTIRRMRTDTYKVINTVNYLLLTNYKDGVPVDDNSTRYFPIFSRWQTKEDIDAFKLANPRYYTKLHQVLDDGEAVRKWFMDYPLHDEFNPAERAPTSAAMDELRYLNKDETQESLGEILDLIDRESEPGMTRELLESPKLADKLADEGIAVPYGRAWKRLLTEAGFSYLGSIKIDGKMKKFWSRTPSKFRDEAGKPIPQLIREALETI